MSENEKPNPFFKRPKRSDCPNLPTDNANAFFGANYLAKIVEVNDTKILYIDEKGTEYSILLVECKRNSDLNGLSGYIAKRGFLSSPPWVEFFDENKTRFEFELRKDAQFFVWDMLSQKGFKTIDMD